MENARMFGSTFNKQVPGVSTIIYILIVQVLKALQKHVKNDSLFKFN